MSRLLTDQVDFPAFKLEGWMFDLNTFFWYQDQYQSMPVLSRQFSIVFVSLLAV